ncbi:hypothetical protein LY78DRAFT_660148 [Colletotrichum sublineola]|nr:hypothetical protein LY78DRAFT_660148 [Colletotrichum sublineola]
MDGLRSDQALALALVICGVLEFPRACFLLACSWLSWETIIRRELSFVSVTPCIGKGGNTGN